MRRRATVVVFALALAACGDAGTTGSVDSADPTTTTTTTVVTSEPPASSTTTTTTSAAPGDLAIQLCDDVERPVPSVVGTLPGGTNTPFELDGVLLTYAAEHPDTYVNRWIDRDYGGVIVMAFTDDPAPHLEAILQRRPMDTDVSAIEPRPPITVDWTVAESGFAVDVVQVRYTAGELQDLQREIGQAFDGSGDPAVVGIGSGGINNRVSLNMIRPTPEDLAVIAAAFPDRTDMLCLEGQIWDPSMAPPSVDEPFTVMADAGSDPMVTCVGNGPFRLSALDGPPDIDPASDDPLVVALLTSRPGDEAVPTTGWRTLRRDDDRALLANFEGPSVLSYSFELTPGGWTLRGSSAGECSPRLAVPDGVGIMEVGLDPEHPIDPTSTTLHLNVRQRSCSGGASGVENMRPPEVIESEAEIRIAIAVVPPEGPQTCPGNEAAPITIELDAPIGNRTVMDGMQVPPTPLAEILN